MSFLHRTLLRLTVFLSAAVTAMTPTLAGAQPYPARPVRLIVPFPAGGATDAAARELGEGLSKLLGQPFVVENRPGADGGIAAAAVFGSAPDGYTLFFASSSIEGVPLVQKVAAFKSLLDFTPISLVCRLSFGLVINPAVPARTVQELSAYAKANPNRLNFGSGSLSELMAAAQFMNATGTQMVKVNYKGGVQIIPDLFAGQVQVSFGPLTPMLPLLREQRLIALATLGDQRAAVVPDVPSTKEAGVPGVTGAGGLQALMGPPRLPPTVVERLASAVETVMANEEVRRKFMQRGQEPESSTGEALASMLRAEREQWNRFVADTGIRPE